MSPHVVATCVFFCSKLEAWVSDLARQSTLRPCRDLWWLETFNFQQTGLIIYIYATVCPEKNQRVPTGQDHNPTIFTSHYRNFGYDPTRNHYPNAGNPGVDPRHNPQHSSIFGELKPSIVWIFNNNNYHIVSHDGLKIWRFQRSTKHLRPTRALRGMALILDQLGLNARSMKDIIALDGALCHLAKRRWVGQSWSTRQKRGDYDPKTVEKKKLSLLEQNTSNFDIQKKHQIHPGWSSKKNVFALWQPGPSQPRRPAHRCAALSLCGGLRAQWRR